jgi:glutamyl-tRNA reductase
VDIVLCSTGAQEPVLTKKGIEQVMRTRKGRWLFLIDIAVPRDVEPQVGQLENVYLYDVDGLQQVVDQNRAGRAREATAALTMIEDELKRLQAHELQLGVVPTIKLLRAHFVAVAQAEAERFSSRLQSVSERDRATVKQLVESIVNKLLHRPLTVLKQEAQEAPDSELAETVRALFDLHTGQSEEIRLEEDNVVPIKSGEK